MQATAFVLTSSPTPYVKLEHGQGDKREEISFSISVFSRKNFQGESSGTFDHINEFWKQLPETQQDRIFEIYKAIEHGIDNIYNQKDLTEYLTDRVAELIAAHDLEIVQYWVQNKSGIVIPEGFKTEFKADFDNNTSREKTYTRGDYVRLVSLAVLLRCMIPVWGTYISHIRTDTGTLYKEYNAFQLLNKSEVIRCEAMKKLGTYVESIVGEDKFNANNVHAGISSEDFCYWLTALICIRRLCVGNVYGTDTSVHLVAYVYKFIKRHVQGAEASSESAIRDKRDDDKDASGFADKVSVLERYKIKFNISPGEVVELENSLSDINSAVSRITSRVNPVILSRSLVTSRELDGKRLLDPQINILRWVFKSVISPRGMMYMPNHQIIQALGACEAILWSLDYKYLAVLVTSYPELTDRPTADMRISHTDSKMQIPPEMIARLNAVYPYNRVIKGKKPDASKADIKVVNPAVKAIGDLADNLRMSSWRPTCHTSMVEEVFGVTNRRTPIRPDIKIELTRLVVDLGERSWT